jgi:circadian clock protein KaiC
MWLQKRRYGSVRFPFQKIDASVWIERGLLLAKRAKPVELEIPMNGDISITPLPKARTGISGLDEISGGGLPRGRTTIVCGGPGCGKTMLGMEFLIRGAHELDEPGVLVAFEETPQEMERNVASLGFDLKGLVNRKKLFLDYVFVEPSEIQETGDYDLEGLFIRLQHAVDSIGAKRVCLDTLEALFSGFHNEGVLRAELRRLFRWLKDRNLTTVITAEKGEKTLTRHGLEEYVSDCVILLDHRIRDQISTRRLRIVKYRGTKHGADEYPFLIDDRGMSVLPVTSLEMQHKVSDERVPTGIADLDEMLGGKGFYRGSSVLISGTAGSGKTTMAASFAEAACIRGERCLYIGFEESVEQVARNMRSVGVDLGKWTANGLLAHEAWRPSQYGIEMHLLRIHKLVDAVKPQHVIVDPVTNLINASAEKEVYSMLMRLMDYLKSRQITSIFTNLTQNGEALEKTDLGVSSLTDTWILCRDLESNGERNRCVYVLKSRGMQHSNQVREFVMSRDGIRLISPYIGSGVVLTGSARIAQEAKEKAEALVRAQDIEKKQEALERKRSALEAQMKVMKLDFGAEELELERVIGEQRSREMQLQVEREAMDRFRRGRGELSAGSAVAGGAGETK